MAGFVEKMNRWGKAGTPFLFLLDFELAKPVVLRLSDIDASEIAYQIGAWTNVAPVRYRPLAPLKFTPPERRRFDRAFERVQEEIRAGNTYLLNLCFPVRLEGPLSLAQIFEQTQAKYKLRYRDEFVCFSPEIFVRIRDGIISTYPMKGTLDASVPDAAERLRRDPKERAEHATIVDLMRNDLSRVATDICVKRFMYLDTLHTDKGDLLQMSSEITGRLPDDYPERIGDILASLLPAGSVSGAPKRKTVEIIGEVEQEPRGYYTGVAGIFDGRQLDSAVMIRFVEQRDGGYYYRSGGGVTFQSDPDREYEELERKVYLPLRMRDDWLVESIRLEGGRFFHVEWHQARMNRVRRALYGDVPEIDLADVLYRRLGEYSFGGQRMRVRVLYDAHIRRVEAMVYRRRRISSLRVVELFPVEEGLLRYKWADRRLWKALYGLRGDADDVLVVRDGLVTDTTIANVAFWDGRRWLTPAQPLMEGTTRMRLLASDELVPADIRVSDLASFEKIRLFNAMAEWELPIDAVQFTSI